MAKEQQPAVVAQTVMLPIGKIETNHGQIDGLPKNPRVLRDEQYKKLKKSIEDNPEMLTLRELLVYPHNGKYVVIGGNMRLRILQDLGEKEVPCKIIAEDTSVDKLRAYTIKDNTSGGEWDWDDLANEWDADELDSWGLETPDGWGVNPDDFGDDFSLKDGDKAPFQQMSFVLADEQANVIKKAMKDAQHLEEYKYMETMGNTNSNGNALYLIVKQWADARK